MYNNLQKYPSCLALAHSFLKKSSTKETIPNYDNYNL